MERVKRILDALGDAISETHQCPVYSVVSHKEAFFPFHKEWKDSPSLLAHLHETIGAIDLLQVTAAPDAQLDYLLIPLSKLILAAHLHRLAGEPERAAAVAGRALVELRALVAGDRLHTKQDYDGRIRPPYVWEMIGDAAVCINPDEARFAYHKAESLFRKLGELEEAAEGNELFPGDFHAFQAHYFLQGKPSSIILHSSVRLRLKRTQWLGG